MFVRVVRSSERVPEMTFRPITTRAVFVACVVGLLFAALPSPVDAACCSPGTLLDPYITDPYCPYYYSTRTGCLNRCFYYGYVAAYCTACPSGSYSNQYDQTTCTICPYPYTHYSTGQLAASGCSSTCNGGTRWVNNIPGTWSNGAVVFARTGCVTCEAGTYSTAPAGQLCIACPPGYTSAAGSASCPTACPIGQTTSLTATPYGYSRTACVVCAIGWSTPAAGSAACSQCVPGYKNPTAGGACTACLANTYQSAPGQATCANCPTNTQSAAGASGCTYCPAGTSSVSGQPCLSCPEGWTSISGYGCTACPVGSYSNAGTGFLCRNCQTGFTTAGTGTISSAGCVDINECTVGPQLCQVSPVVRPCVNTPGTYECGACPQYYYAPDPYSCEDINECAVNNGGCDTHVVCTNNIGAPQTCAPCPQPEFAGNPYISGGCIRSCASQPCQNGAACTNPFPNNPTYVCVCVPGFEGTICQTDINECASNPCVRGTCMDGPNFFTCQCPAGYSGRRCETEINECGSTPCQHGGLCTDLLNAFTCTCAAGYSGTVCETNVDECASQPCQNGATCVDAVNSYSCVCPAGFSGVQCETDIDECASQPCTNGGTCQDKVNSWTCTCAAGYSGVRCQFNINECASLPCQHGGTCVDAVNSFSCSCVAGYSGLLCDTDVNECASIPCQNTGACTDLVNAFTCTCAAGYSGLLCSTDINECASQPCANGGTCTDGVNYFTCACPAGYSGAQCQTDINECASTPCQNGATCHDLVNHYTCECVIGYLGVLCETDINECASDPCVNGGTCVDRPNAFGCACPPTWGGALCQTKLYTCNSMPCRNGGNCVEFNIYFECECAPGFTGVICQTDVNECASQPCANGGTCADDVNRHVCACTPGWTGSHCLTDINECASNPCRNGGTCRDLLNAYTCECAGGYSGRTCETNVNECASAPCRNGGTCVDGSNQFTCICASGYSGLLCQTDINECASLPCRNTGTCVDAVNGFSCLCPGGFSGARCQTNINECASLPCRNAGVCSDRVNGFACNCVAGWSGAQCQTDINECSSTPCQNGGTCTDKLNSFTCACAAGFSGRTCETDINECSSQPCVNGGTCADAVNGFTCVCPGGYSGRICETDVNECASAPCLNSGVCSDARNGYTCDCTGTGYSGTICQTDVNECATANAGCPSFGGCANTIGSYSCVYIVPGSVADGTAFAANQTVAYDNVVLNGVLRQPIVFRLFAAPATQVVSQYRASLVGATGTELFQCDTLTVQRVFSSAERLVSCSLAPGYGAGYSFVLWAGAVNVSIANQTVSFPAPRLYPRTLRQIDALTGSIVVPPSSQLVLADGSSVLVAFEGTNFVPSETTASFGPRAKSGVVDGGLLCEVQLALSNSTFITCVTASNKGGTAANVFHVTVAGQSVTGTDTISFPVVPFVQRVSGCVDPLNSNVTTDCDTRGGTTITVFGINLLSELVVDVNSAPCIVDPLSVAPEGTSFECKLPPGIGFDRVIAVRSRGQPSIPRPFVSYGVPLVTGLAGCRQLEPASLGVGSCSRTGGETVTVTGKNFGSANADVLVGVFRASNILHTPGSENTELSFLTPPGFGTHYGVVIIQSGGNVGRPSTSTNATTLSYSQCNPGFKSNGVDCVPCPEATYTDGYDQSDCKSCPFGKSSGPAPSSGCTPCEPGSVSLGGESSCHNCTAGYAQSASGQAQCQICEAGRFSAHVGSTICEPCPPQSYSALGGSTACSGCSGVLFQPAIGQVSCVSCTPGQYYHRASAQCRLCPSGLTCTESGLHATDGYYVFVNDNGFLDSHACLPGYCSQCEVTQTSAPLTNGSVGSNVTGPDARAYAANAALVDVSSGAIYSCCGGSRPDASNNALCGQCLPDYFLNGSECVYCTKANVSLMTLIILMSWAYITLFHRLAQIARPDTRILVNFGQMVYVFLNVQTGGITSWLAVLQFDLFSTSGGTCMAPLSDLQRLCSGLFFPAICAVLLLVNLGIHYLIWSAVKAGYCASVPCCGTSRRAASTATAFDGQNAESLAAVAAAAAAEPEEDLSHQGCCDRARGVLITLFTVDVRRRVTFHPIVLMYRRTLLAFMCAAYPAVAQVVFVFFSCTATSLNGGSSYVVQYPAISCTSDQYNTLRPFFVIAAILVVALPIAMFFRLRQLKQNGRLSRDLEIALIYGPMTEGYPRRRYFWECLVLGRRMIVAAVALAAFPDDVTLKNAVLCGCNIVFLTIHLIFKPYSALLDNLAESLSLVTLTILTLFLTAAPRPLTTAYAAGLCSLVFLVGAIFAIRVVTSRFEKLIATRGRTASAIEQENEAKQHAQKEAQMDRRIAKMIQRDERAAALSLAESKARGSTRYLSPPVSPHASVPVVAASTTN